MHSEVSCEKTSGESKATQRYREFVAQLPAPGGGGAHTAIFKAGCLGCRAGIGEDALVAEIRDRLPAGTRVVSDSEIEQGVRAGFAAVNGGQAEPARMAPCVAPGVLTAILKAGRGSTETDIRRRSPVKIDWPEAEGWRVLDMLYGKDERVFVGDDGRAGRMGETIRPVCDWCMIFRKTGTGLWPKVMVNPLTGQPAPKKSGEGMTLRGDACIAAHRFAVAEFDNLSIEDQLAFWMAVPHLPVSAIVHSGKKSLHAWIRVDCRDSSEWETEISGKLFPGYLQPLGLDPACKNPSRLSRMPGHTRVETGIVQRCIYLAPEGRAVGA